MARKLKNQASLETSFSRARNLEKRGFMQSVALSRDHELALEAACVGEDPPKVCPICGDSARLPAKDLRDQWTWDCKEGCNP